MDDIRECVQCGASFAPLREHARFCSPWCRLTWNREHVSCPSPGEEALDWAMAAMADTSERLLRARGWDLSSGFALITEAVWWVTMVDATLLRYHPDAYGMALARESSTRRDLIEDTFGGLRFVRNRMGFEADEADFIRVCSSSSGAPAKRLAAWKWKAVAEPPVSALTSRGQEWELTRYESYRAQLAGHSVGDTFAEATAFLRLASERSREGQRWISAAITGA